MKLLDAVYEVLSEAKEPMHYEDILRRIRDRGLWTSQGETPEATINS